MHSRPSRMHDYSSQVCFLGIEVVAKLRVHDQQSGPKVKAKSGVPRCFVIYYVTDSNSQQRAFRQRKEGYIKKLEQQVRDYSDMENNYKAMQSENYALREYVIQLQSRLLGAQGEYPQPPPNINLSHPGLPHPAQPPAPIPAAARAPEPAPSAAGPAAGTPLEAVAQAVANLERAEHPYSTKQTNSDEARTAEEIGRQLHGDGIPAASM